MKESTSILNEILDGILKRNGNLEEKWNDFFMELNRPRNTHLKNKRYWPGLKYNFLALPNSEEDFVIAGCAAARYNCIEHEIELYLNGLNYWPGLLDKIQTKTIESACQIAKEMVTEASPDQMRTCARALLQTFYRGSGAIVWLKPVIDDSFGPLNEVGRYEESGIGENNNYVSEKANEASKWVKAELISKQSLKNESNLSQGIKMLWPANPVIRLAIYIALERYRSDELKSVLLSLCLNKRCRKCGSQTVQVPVMRFDFSAISCIKCGTDFEQFSIEMGFFIGRGFRDLFRIAGLTRIIRINCAQISFFETYAMIPDTDTSLIKNFINRFNCMANFGMGFGFKPYCSRGFIKNILLRTSNPGPGYHLVSINLVDELMGKEKDFQKAYNKYLDYKLEIGFSFEQEFDEWNSLMKKADSLYEQGLYDEAVMTAEKALQIIEPIVGTYNVEVVTNLDILAKIYKAQGKYDQTEKLFIRSLAIYEKTWDLDNPIIIKYIDQLARLYTEQGKYNQAEPLFMRSLSIGEKALGPDHPDVAVSLVNLAGLYKKTGREIAAKELEKRAAAIRAKK